MEKINLNAALAMSDAVFRRTVTTKLNQLADALNTGVVWENKVEALRAVEQVYDDLPVTVTAEMIAEEASEVTKELRLETEAAQ